MKKMNKEWNPPKSRLYAQYVLMIFGVFVFFGSCVFSEKVGAYNEKPISKVVVEEAYVDEVGRSVYTYCFGYCDFEYDRNPVYATRRQANAAGQGARYRAQKKRDKNNEFVKKWDILRLRGNYLLSIIYLFIGLFLCYKINGLAINYYHHDDPRN